MAADQHDEALDALVQSYMAHMQQQGEAAGKTPEQMAQGLQYASFILLLRLLQNHLGEGVELSGPELLALWPGSPAALFGTVAELLQVSQAEAKDICAEFQQLGWLQSDLRPSPAGLTVAGLASL
ncbi:MAG: hypothetical protein IGS03_08930 [Candidatus Sericytochromatia bacterium]|nr:hypothetical protein [Candidatus Sericytochromatia bacterium]